MFPIRDSVPTVRTPVIVYLLIAANTAIFLYQNSLGSNASAIFAYEYGLVPIRYFDPFWGLRNGLPADDYWPFLTAAFLHGGWLHIILNMWTLFIFGQTMEGRMGSIPFLAFYLACAMASTAVHAWFNPLSDVPVIGASGAIAGVIGAYALTFPTARITLLVPIIIIPLIFDIPAIAFAIIWFGMQVLQGAWESLTPSIGGGIAWWAHIGGFIAGIILLPLFLAFAPRQRQTSAPWQQGPWG
jgi:membrane associated rhomboid family serine protease